jgi:hypothetical protein
MQQTIGRPLAKGTILDVIADDSGTLLVAAPKQVPAIVMVRRRLVYGLMIVLVGHGDSYLTSRFFSRMPSPTQALTDRVDPALRTAIKNCMIIYSAQHLQQVYSEFSLQSCRRSPPYTTQPRRVLGPSTAFG